MEIPENLKTYFEQYLDVEETPDWHVSHEKMQKIKQAAAESLGPITPELRKQWFKNYGCANGWANATSFLYGVASCLHAADVKAHPELHEAKSSTPYNCYHVEGCKCGFSYEYDSSD